MAKPKTKRPPKPKTTPKPRVRKSPPVHLAGALKAAGIDSGRTDLTMVAPEALTVITDPAHPLYDPSVNLPLDEVLIASIGKHGVMKAIEVQRDGEDGKGVPIIIVSAGRQRTRNACEWNRRNPDKRVRVPIVQARGNDLSAVLRAIAENAHTVNKSPLSAAWKCRTAIQLGGTEEEVIAAAGLRGGAAELHDLLTLLDLTPEAQQAVESKAVPRTSVRELARLPKSKQPRAVKMIADHTEDRGGKTAKRHEVAAVVEAVKLGATEAPKLPERLKMAGRPEVDALAKLFAEHSLTKGPRTPEEEEATNACHQILRHLLGHEDALELLWLRDLVRGHTGQVDAFRESHGAPNNHTGEIVGRLIAGGAS